MSNIRVDVEFTIQNGTEVSFTAPCDCSEVTGLKVYHQGGSKEFAFTDSHGNVLHEIGNVFAAGAVVKVILDVSKGHAYIQNADTNAYLEAQLASKRPNTWMPTASDVGAEPATADSTYPGCYYRMVNGVKQWLNPPMIPNEEYQTTERRNGKVVYKKKIKFGYLPALGTTKNLAVNLYEDFEYTGKIYSTQNEKNYDVQALPAMSGDGNPLCWCVLHRSSVDLLVAAKDLSSVYQAEIVVSYTKD